MKENLSFKETRKIIATANREEIAYINHIVESYDGIMVMTTIDPEEARIVFDISPFLFDEALTILSELSKETSLEIKG